MGPTEPTDMASAVEISSYEAGGSARASISTPRHCSERVSMARWASSLRWARSVICSGLSL